MQVTEPSGVELGDDGFRLIVTVGIFADTEVRIERVEYSRYFVLSYATVKLDSFALGALDDARVGVYPVEFYVYTEALKTFGYVLTVELAFVDCGP